MQRPTAVATDIARPFSVVDLPQSGQYLGLAFWPHREGAGKILETEQSGIADLPQQTTSCALGLLASRRTRQQAGKRERRDRHYEWQAGDGIKQLSLCARWRCYQAEPNRITGQQIGHQRAEPGIDWPSNWPD